jgi:ribosome-associated translation inhibitor RaiA
MNHQFHFKNFEPEFKLRFQSNLIFNRILDEAPYGAIGVGLLEKQGEEEYRCALDIYSNHGPLMASAVSSTPEQALEALEEKIKKQIAWWKSHCSETYAPSQLFSGRPTMVAS